MEVCVRPLTVMCKNMLSADSSLVFLIVNVRATELPSRHFLYVCQPIRIHPSRSVTAIQDE